MKERPDTTDKWEAEKATTVRITLGQVIGRLEALAAAATYAATALRNDPTGHPTLAWSRVALNTLGVEIANTEGLVLEYREQVRVDRPDEEDRSPSP